MDSSQLEATARAMVAPGKGVLAIDETPGTCTKRFTEFDIESTPESRRDYRQLLVTSPGLSDYISGVILVDETFRSQSSDGRPIPEVVRDAGMIPGIKVDTGAKPLANAPGETVTEGLDGLRDRLAGYYENGARFTKWRAVIRIGDGMPSRRCVESNAHALGRYAALAQEAGLVPIVEPEVLMTGAHGFDRCQEVTEEVLRSVFAQLALQGVLLEGIILKPNMVIPGEDAPKASPAEVARHTVDTLRRCVPAAVPGIAFLSGGQTGEEACANLDAMARMGPHPWQLTYSYGRALQYPAIQVWSGRDDAVRSAQDALLHRSRMASLAQRGQYSGELERQAA